MEDTGPKFWGNPPVAMTERRRGRQEARTGGREGLGAPGNPSEAPEKRCAALLRSSFPGGRLFGSNSAGSGAAWRDAGGIFLFKCQAGAREPACLRLAVGDAFKPAAGEWRCPPPRTELESGRQADAVSRFPAQAWRAEMWKGKPSIWPGTAVRCCAGRRAGGNFRHRPQWHGALLPFRSCREVRADWSRGRKSIRCRVCAVAAGRADRHRRSRTGRVGSTGTREGRGGCRMPPEARPAGGGEIESDKTA